MAESSEIKQYEVIHNQDTNFDNIDDECTNKENESHQITINYDPIIRFTVNFSRVFNNLIENIHIQELFNQIEQNLPSIYGAILGAGLGYIYGDRIVHYEFKNNHDRLAKVAYWGSVYAYEYAVKGAIIGATYIVSVPALVIYQGSKYFYNK